MYETLKTALLALTDISFCEWAWKTRPRGDYGTIRLDFEVDADNGDNSKVDRAWEGSVDLFLHAPDGTKEAEVETQLEAVCGNSWTENSRQYEAETGLLHIEWTFQVEGR